MEYVYKAFSVELISSTITLMIYIECRINYYWTKLCLSLDVRSGDY